MHNEKKMTALTLIEVMIVITILGILASIAYPIYSRHSLKKNRVVAIASLLEARSRVEKCYLNSADNSYIKCSESFQSVDEKNLFQVSFFINKNTGYQLTASNLNAKNDPQCPGFYILENGVKGVTNVTVESEIQRCWSQ